MKIEEITQAIEAVAPLPLQESYDNSGLLIGEPDREVNRALITLDVTDEVIDEAIENGYDLIIAHHPLIFGSIKKINIKNPVERMIARCIKNDIAVYAAHTNLDNVKQGVNTMIAEKIGLQNLSILAPKDELLRKLVAFCPVSHAGEVRQAMFEAGAGHIGNYDSCSFNLKGHGTFRAGEGSDPFVGDIGKIHFEEEERIEVIYPVYQESRILQAMKKAHPYEEVAYDIYPLKNTFENVGAGMLGELKEPVLAKDFLVRVKKTLGCGAIRHTKIVKDKVKKIAVCGGSGSFLINRARRAGADVFLTGDIKYHDFFLADGKMLIADVGHYESEQYTKDLLMNIINKNFSTFAVRNSEVNTNPINYL